MNTPNQLINDLRNLPATVHEVDYRQWGYHFDVLLEAGQVRGFADMLRAHRFYLVFVSAVHTTPAIEIIYQFACYSRQCRIVGRAPVKDNGAMPTISDIFDGANWHERETRDMFGVLFTGHPYLEPLLLPEEEADRKPLLKEGSAVKAADSVRRPAQTGTETTEPQLEQERER